MIRVCGPNIIFYSHRFDDALLDCVADKNDPTTPTQIQKYVTIIDDQWVSELNLLIADHRRIIIQILDAIQQILST